MNRKFKSALSVLLVITMALSLGISAFAEETEGQEQPVVCTGSADANDCAADTHVGSCPEQEQEQSPAAGAEEKQEQGQEQPPAAGAEEKQEQGQPAVCTGNAEVTDCAAATHIEGCPKFVKAEPATENESDEKAAVQKRIDALPGSGEFAAMDDAAKQAVADEYAAIMEALYKLCEAEGIEDGDIDKLEGINLKKLLALSDAINEYAATAAPVAVYAAWIGETGYTTLYWTLLPLLIAVTR